MTIHGLRPTDMNNTLKILLVEDDGDDLRLFIDALDETGLPYALSSVVHCDELFDRLEEGEKPDLIFLDINLPGMNGHQCLRQLKADRKYRGIPVLMYSGSKSLYDIEKAYEEGAHLYIVKPYAHANWVTTFKKVFQHDWKQGLPVPPRSEFLINTAFV